MIPVRAVALLVAVAAPVFAAPPPSAPPSTDASPNRRINIEFRGKLRDALKAIAQQGGLNLMVTGPLEEDAEVYLKDVSAEEALRTVAQAYHLEVRQSGSIWTLRATTPAERAEAPEATPPAPATPKAPPAPELPPVPPLPPLPEIKPGMAEEAIERAMREAEAAAERAQEEADRALAQAEKQLGAIADDGSESAERMREKAEQLRERADELRERAEEARDRAREAREQAREALRAARKVMHERVGFAGPVVVKEDEVVKEAVAYGGPITVEGHVEDDVVSFGGPVKLGPKAWVEGDVVSFGGEIERAEGAIVEGDIKAIGGDVVGVAAKDVARKISQKQTLSSRVERDEDHSLAWFLAWFAVLFGVGFAGSLLAPARMKAIQEDVRRQPLRSGAVGLLGAIMLLPLTILLCVTLIGIPVALLILWPLAILGAAIGFTTVASEIGLRLPILRGRKTQALVLALGLALLLAVGFIPVLGPITLTLAELIGFGAVLRTRFGGRGQTPGPFTRVDIPNASAL
ncbi:MAG: hypothetical protein IRZ16_24305, partial [Myxococcaceae bacterium]|nr:hypothetical protein [Myxococcaceae bacterium]